MTTNKPELNKSKRRPVIPVQLQVYTSLFLTLILFVNLFFFSNESKSQVIYNFFAAIVLVLLLWQSALVIHRWVDSKCSLEVNPIRYTLVSIAAAYFTSIGAVLIVDVSINLVIYQQLPSFPNSWSGFFAAFLIMVVMLTIITLVKHFQYTKEKLQSINEGIIESIAEGVLVTDLDDNIIVYNTAFKRMWLLEDEALQEGMSSVALAHAIKNVENADEIFKIISQSNDNPNERISLVAHLKNKRVLEGISMPQIVDGKVVGRIWSNRDITERINAERKEIERGVAQAQFDSLKNQVNPHFLFNSLNVLSSLVHINADLSEKFIDQLAKSYRYLLEQKDNELVALKTEIEFVHAFSFLLKIRFEEKLKININLPAEAMNDLVAPLTLQLLIENAVKHNTISQEAPLIIDICIEREDVLVVRNNIQTRMQRMPSTGVGLKNIISRYNLLTSRAPEFRVLNDTYEARIPLMKIS